MLGLAVKSIKRFIAPPLKSESPAPCISLVAEAVKNTLLEILSGEEYLFEDSRSIQKHPVGRPYAVAVIPTQPMPQAGHQRITIHYIQRILRIQRNLLFVLASLLPSHL